MKKNLLYLLALLFNVNFVMANRSVEPMGDSATVFHQCSIAITGNFDSECIYDFKDEITDEYPNLMIACKHSTVTYTAYANTGSASVVSYIWEVYGDMSHSASGNQLVVDWSDDEWGMVVVTVVNSEGDTCTEFSRVKLIDNPTVGSTTVPAYTVMPDGRKIIRVCKGASIQFIDQSSAGNSDIAGYHWECNMASPSSTPNYFIEDVYMNDIVTHRVYNNCGCYDEEFIEIELIEGTNLELECYGTVCENAIVTYHVVAPHCNEYHWYVEGGTIVDGQGTDHPVVQWDNPANGYGVIGLDGILCGDIACPTMMSKKIPVIQNHLAIEGQTDVCVGEAVLFSLPLLGSTEYNWSITPSSGVNTYMMPQSNEIRLVFNQAGTYQLQCTYLCDFLGCGPYDAEPLTITVKPKFDITGNDQVCVSNACDLQTSPSVTAHWTAYDLSFGNQVETTATGSAFTHVFSHPGRYLIAAENTSFCGPATFVLNVKDVPPAPAITDLDPNNRHTACPNSGIALSGTPSEPNYSLVWEPVCSSASPQQYSGDSVTISYLNEVCDIRVYNYDRVLQCQSSNYHVHQVDELTPAHLNIPANITVCPNSLIVWGDNEIPDQSSEGMLYEWTIQDNMQHCASVQGSHLSNNVTWAINEIATPATFYVKLTRTYCGNSTDTIIYIRVTDSSHTTLSISGPDPVCLNTYATYTGSGGSSSNFRWEIEDNIYSGNPVTHQFQHEGLREILLYENPYTYCNNPNYLNSAIKQVFVNPLPMVQGLTFNSQTNTISVLPTPFPSGYTFSWVFRANAQSPDIPLPGTTDHITPSSFGTYSCTVTDVSTGCSKKVSLFYQGNFPGIQCNPMTLSGNYDFCTHSITLSAGHYNPFVSWQVSGGESFIYKYGTGNRYADITFNNIGIYTVSATSGIANCYSGSRVITVNFIPEFLFKPACNKIEVTNTSKYALPGETAYITVTNSCNSNVDVIAIPASQTSYTYTPTGFFIGPCTYSFTLTGYGTNGNIAQPCPLANVTIGSPLLPIGVSPVTISTANPYPPYTNTCDNTPFELTATLGYSGSIVSSTWSFGDASSYQINGNAISHTFEANSMNNVTVSIVDNRGCVRNSNPITITSNPNALSNGDLNVLGAETCPIVGTRNVEFSIANLHYWWWSHKNPTQTPYSNPYPTHKPDDYFVYAVNDNYCQKEATKFVKFKNAPTVFIYADNFNCCVGNEIMLYGEQGPNSDPLTYSWTITGSGGFSQTSTNPNIVFLAPYAGTFNVTLTITNTTCSSTATETITVNTQPPAPTLSFVGSPCINDAPVHLQASGFSGEMHWSNGNTGPDAYYFTHGLASAYYYDPSVGCPSESGTIRIHKQPDFDALLTGCYEKCKYFFTYNLPVYGLTDDMQSISWEWHMNGSSIATGNGNYTFSPLQLPLLGFGDYQMFVSYSNNNCNAASPLLKIDSKETCDCDSINITYEKEIRLEDCHLFYDMVVTVCNNSRVKRFCFDEIFLDENAEDFVKLNRTHLRPIVISPMDCDTFHISIEVFSLIPSAVNLKIIDDSCSNCEKEFSIDLKPEKIECEMEMHLDDYSIIPEFSSNVAAYFDFHMNVHPCQNLLAFWTEPPMVINYWYDGAAMVQGLGMVDFATLTQLMTESGEICFYAITCEGDKLCKRRVCISAEEVYNILHDMGLAKTNTSGSGEGSGTKQMLNPDLGNDTEPHLMPNPTTGEVNVIGTTDEVVEVLVMDMNGRPMATFDNTSNFNISTLSSGIYIVRVKTHRDNTDKVTYLKLVKK